MTRSMLCVVAAGCLTAATASASLAQQQAPPFETKKVEGTDNVYIFRNGNHQAMFIVTTDGVIATDPVGLRHGRPAARPTSTRSRRSPTSRSNT